jgi:hypothetical protein
LGEKEYLKSTKDGDGNEIKIYKRISPVFKSISQIIVACVIRWVNVNQFYFSSKVAFKGV